MEEKHIPGGKQFVIVLVMAAILYIFCGTMMSLFGEYAFIGGIIALMIFAFFGFSL